MSTPSQAATEVTCNAAILAKRPPTQPTRYLRIHSMTITPENFAALVNAAESYLKQLGFLQVHRYAFDLGNYPRGQVELVRFSNLTRDVSLARTEMVDEKGGHSFEVFFAERNREGEREARPDRYWYRGSRLYWYTAIEELDDTRDTPEGLIALFRHKYLDLILRGRVWHNYMFDLREWASGDYTLEDCRNLREKVFAEAGYPGL